MSGSKENDSKLNGRQGDAADGVPSGQDEQHVQDDVNELLGTDQNDSEEDLAALLTEAQEKVAHYHEELLRAKAEVENIRRRSQEEVTKARKFGVESFAESLVPVKDSLEAALSLEDQDACAWQEGVETTLRQLVNAFERHALREISSVIGERFDPHLHQAISTVPSDQPEGTLVQVLQKGYTISERVLRPALVMVSAGPQQGS